MSLLYDLAASRPANLCLTANSWVHAGTITFILSLKKGLYQYQFGQYAWTHMILFVVFTQSAFTVANVYEGILWFLLPVALIIINDISAYLVGFFFGRTPLIKLSPKKTWEGFMGASVITMAAAFLVSRRAPAPSCAAQRLQSPRDSLELVLPAMIPDRIGTNGARVDGQLDNIGVFFESAASFSSALLVVSDTGCWTRSSPELARGRCSARGASFRVSLRHPNAVSPHLSLPATSRALACRSFLPLTPRSDSVLPAGGRPGPLPVDDVSPHRPVHGVAHLRPGGAVRAAPPEAPALPRGAPSRLGAGSAAHRFFCTVCI